VNFVASSHGYLNQNEYALHFALPPGPEPGAPLAGRVFDLVVDFPGRPARGLLRIDPQVNPALGGLVLAELQEREISVFRSGKVWIDGIEYPPAPGGFALRLRETGGGLVRPDPALALAEPEPAPGPAHWEGLELQARGGARLSELLLDAQLAAPPADGDFNLVLWDVTDRLHPVRLFAANERTSPRNRRSTFPLELVLEEGRVYRCAARVSELRPSLLRSVEPEDVLAAKGGLSFEDPEPETGKRLVDAALQPASVLALRYAPVLRGGRGTSAR